MGKGRAICIQLCLYRGLRWRGCTANCTALPSTSASAAPPSPAAPLSSGPGPLCGVPRGQPQEPSGGAQCPGRRRSSSAAPRRRRAEPAARPGPARLIPSRGVLLPPGGPPPSATERHRAPPRAAGPRPRRLRAPPAPAAAPGPALSWGVILPGRRRALEVKGAL